MQISFLKWMQINFLKWMQINFHKWMQINLVKGRCRDFFKNMEKLVVTNLERHIF